MNTYGVVIISILFGFLRSQTTEDITTTPASDLTVRFQPPYDPYIITTDMANKLLSCDFQSNTLITRTNWYHNGTYLTSSNSYTIKEVNTNVSGNYTCVLTSGFGFNVSASKQVVVQYGPTVTSLSDQRIVEHSNLVVRCSVTGNPSPTIIWSRDGVPSFQNIGNVLKINNILRISSGTYTCTASNMLTPSGASTVNKTYFKTISIDVIYTPDIRLDPPTNPFIAYAEQTVVKIVCLVISANPNIISYRWTDSANTTRSNSRELTLYNISRHMAGDYTCFATNQVGTTFKTVNIKVQYAPIIEQISNQTVTESGTLDLTCKANSDPPVSKYWWIQRDGTVVNSSRLRITSIIRSQSGFYSCYAENILTPTGGPNNITIRKVFNLHVDVRYGPGNSTEYSPSRNQYNLTEGEILPRVICSADCNPPCAFSWTTPVRTIIGNVLNADPISKEERGRYTCYAANTIQTSTASFTVIVNYKPVISKTAFQNAYVQENNKAVLQCRVDSQPLSDMTIEFNSSILFHQSFLNAKDYTISKSDCLHTGTYICKAKNFVGGAMRFTSLFVYCSPRVDARSEPDKKKFVSPNKDTGTLNATIRIIAYPKPEMSWLFRDTSGTIIPLPLETNTTEIVLTYLPPLLTIRLIKYNFTDKDHGEYIVTYSNTYGQLVFTLVTKDIQVEPQSETPIGAIVGSIVGVLVIVVVLSIVVITCRKGFCHKPKLSKTTFSCFSSCKDFNCMKCKDKNEDKQIYVNDKFARELNEIGNKQKFGGTDAENETSTGNKNPTYQTTVARMDSHNYSQLLHHNYVQLQVETSEETNEDDSNNPATSPPYYVNEEQLSVKDMVQNKVIYENVERETNKPKVLPKPGKPKPNKKVKNIKKTGLKAEQYDQVKETKQKAAESPQQTLQKPPGPKINAKATPRIQERCAKLFGDSK